MDGENLCWLSAAELAALIRRKKVSPVEVVKATLERIDRVNPKVNAYVTITAEHALGEAQAAERALMKKRTKLGLLHGVPFSVKDLVFTKGIPTTFGTPLLKDFVPAEDAPFVERLKGAGAIMIGKTNTPAFGWVGVTHNLLFGPTRNPWNLECTPGGSSGGASAAVAAGLGPLAIGTDGGGSIRIPASLAGIYGFKPSYGRIPMYPQAGAWSLSHLGPMTRTVEDAALMMQVGAGPDERDPYSLPETEIDFLKSLRRGVRGMRIAFSDSLGFVKVLDPEVREICAKAARAFEELGGRVEMVNPGWPSPDPCWREIFCSGLASRILPFRDRREEIEPGLYEMLEKSLKNPPMAYLQSWLDRLAWWQHPRAFFEKYDLLLTPTVACPAFPVGLEGPGNIVGQPVDRYGWFPFTSPFNLTGQPAASIPCGFTKGGLPVGLQIVGRRYDDAAVLRASAAFEKVRPWARKKPPAV
jgi:aspartyl-tRNA(Asn)/glutamyl-tRNA(Gln) amidotransferase subunit A